MSRVADFVRDCSRPCDSEPCSDFDCGERCECAERAAVKWLIVAAAFCTAILIFVWTAPALLNWMARQ